MVKKMNSKKRLYCSLIGSTAVALSALVTTYLTLNAHAGGAAFDPTYGGTRSGCYKSFDQSDRNNYSTWNDTCFGASWREYAVGGDYYKHNDDKSKIAQWESDCTAVGANKYYRLGYERFNTFHSADPSKYTARGEQKGFKRVNEISGHGGTVTFNTSGLSWNTVETIYNKGKAIAEANPSDSKWDSFRSKNWSEISGFCWNEEWVNQTAESKFGAFSWVSTTSSAEKKTTSEDSTVSDTITTDQEKVTVNFKHQLGYTPPSDVSGKTFGAASTNYDVKVTKDGTDVTSQANFSTSKSGSADINNNVFTANSSTWSPWLGQSSIEVDVPEGGSVKVCSKITYDPKIIGWKETSSKNYEKDDDTTENRNKFSQACITIKRGDEETEDGGQINFWSSSKVELNGGGDLPSGAWGESDDKDADDDKRTVTLKVSTDQDSINVNFSHKMYKSHTAKDGSDMPGPSSSSDVWPSDICTTYGVVNDQTGTVVDSEEYCHNADPDEIEAPEDYPVTTIPTKQGETVRVCSMISYEPRTITLMRTKKTKQEPDGVGPIDVYSGQATLDSFGNPYLGPVLNPWGAPVQFLGYGSDGTPMFDWDGPVYDGWGGQLYEQKYKEVFDHWEYSKDEEFDNGWSEACIEVTKPDDPDLPPSVKGPNQGDNDDEFMYTGESTEMDWKLEATNYETRRILGYQYIIFQVHVQQGINDANITKGNISAPPTTPRSTSDPCTWYRSNRGIMLRNSLCTAVFSGDYASDGFSTGTGPWKSANSDNYIVPNHVGDKYCNSAGVKWGYWYGVFGGTNGSVRNDWKKYGSEYWTNYDAACRTIVKKPSTSFWNGGVFTHGSIDTISSSRYLNPTFAAVASSPDSTFGSWSEYLAVINGETYNFASGAALAFDGNGRPILEIVDSSKLTISNVVFTSDDRDKVGHSGINSTSTLRDRLSSYIYGSEEFSSNNISGFNTSNTRVIRVNGTATIQGNITTSVNNPGGAINSIYDLPQVVIYASDGINIESGVDRVDAWLITDGVVDTCSSYNLSQSGSDPQAHVQDYPSSRDSACSRQLIINGPVIARGVKLNRTAGSDPLNYTTVNPNGSSLSTDGGLAQAISGEVFNLSAETYLWAYAQAGRYKSSYTEAYSRELPPRY